MRTLTCDEAQRYISTAFKAHHPVRWFFREGALVSPPVQLSSTEHYTVTIHPDSRWWPLVTVEGTAVDGALRFWWPFSRVASFLRARLDEQARERLDRRRLLLMSLERIQRRRRLR